jgi:Tripartite tricarboxylate transporter TctB family
VNSLLRTLTNKRDLYAGSLVVLLGLGTVLQGQTYDIGALTHMGPGFFPVVLGMALILIGILIAGNGATSVPDASEDIVLKKPEWRGWLCVIAGPLSFIAFGKYGGLIPATFACVFISSLGDRTATLKGSLALAAGVTLFGVLLFSYILHIPFPLLRWDVS